MAAINETGVPKSLKTAKELSQRFGLKAPTWRKWAREGVLPHYRVRGVILFDEEDVLAILRRVDGRKSA